MTRPYFIQEHVPLAPYTTLGVGGEARYFADISSKENLVEALMWAQEHTTRVVVIGGGSNLLIHDDGVPGLVIRMSIGGVTYHEEADSVLVHAGAGVVLDELIAETVQRNLWGIENLSSIPGTVGGVPIQNVGAYGVEARDVIDTIEVFDRKTASFHTRTNDACQFSYRNSLFKRGEKDRYIVVAVTFRLSKVPHPRLTYADLAVRFSGSHNATQRDIRDAVREIRSHKFPDWHVIGTAGSFFKNPIIEACEYERLSACFPDIPAYKEMDGRYKISLGWVLDKMLSLKGYRKGNVGLHHEQALVLVNYGSATYEEIIIFSNDIIARVEEAIGIRVEREVVLLT
jgi:UDP-N-acetylmuramate dehydrogenase